MGWFTRRSHARIALEPPRIDGSTWPAAAPGARSGFAAATVRQLGLEAAFTPPAREIGDVVTARLLPLLPLTTTVEDLPHLVDLLRSAARTGAGIGLVEARDAGLAVDEVRGDVAGALGEAERELPPMAADLAAVARYVLHAGHHLARRGIDAVDELETALTGPDPRD